MAGFFYLGGRDQEEARKAEEEDKEQENEQQQQTLLLTRNDEIYNNRGFEIWPQYYHQQQQQPQQNTNNYLFGVGPSTASTTRRSDHPHPHSHQHHHLFNVADDSSRLGFTVMRGGGVGGGMIGGSGGGSSGGGMNCQDCGNQAKKDCPHLRCRTCCKSRGFQCQTHVKSTWVPAAKRRERQQQLSALQHQQDHQSYQQQEKQNAKRLREITQGAGGVATTSTTLATTSRNLATNAGLEVGVQFPAEVNFAANFRCVRVSAMEDAEEELAYQTAVNIGGHVFKGILYDQGPDGGAQYTGSGSGDGSGGSGSAQQRQLNLITAATPATTAATSGNPAAALLDASSLYPAPLNAFMAGTQFFQPPRS